jgi:protein-ribulosamine 3-kinase
MESDGRKLKPTLVHGDLWHGNVGINIANEEVVLYDCCSFYGHHEYELGMFRAARYRTNKSHVRAYHKLMEVSYPQEDHDDRNALYALRVDLEVSCGWPANKRMRLLAMEEMQKLIDKYPDGFEGWQATQTTSVSEDTRIVEG